MSRSRPGGIRRGQSCPKLSSEKALQQRLEWIDNLFTTTKRLPLRRRIDIIEEPLLRSARGAVDPRFELPPIQFAAYESPPDSRGSSSRGQSARQLPAVIPDSPPSPVAQPLEDEENDPADLLASLGAHSMKGYTHARGGVDGLSRQNGMRTTLKHGDRMGTTYSSGSSHEGHRHLPKLHGEDGTGPAKGVKHKGRFGTNDKSDHKSVKDVKQPESAGELGSVLRNKGHKKTVRSFVKAEAAAKRDTACPRLTELEIKDVFRSVTRGTMEALSDVMVLIDIWQIGGYPYCVNREWLEELTEQETEGSFIDTNHFLHIWNGYFDRFEAFQRAVFKDRADDSGMVCESHLPAMFNELGFWPMPGALKEVESSVVDASKRGQGIDVEDFINMYNELYTRAGLTLSEQKHALDIFKQNAGGKDYLNTNQFRSALASIETHFMLTQQEPQVLSDCLLDALVNETLTKVQERTLNLNFNTWSSVLECEGRPEMKEGTIAAHAFLVACNVLHQSVADHIVSVAEKIGISVEDKFSDDDLLNLFDELGHCSPHLAVALQELREDCGVKLQDKTSFGEVYTVLLAFCNLEAFTRKEREDMAGLYSLFTTKLPDVDKDAEGNLATSEIQRVLRWLCYCPSQHRFYDFMDRYVSEDVQFMSFHDLMQTIAIYRYTQIVKVRNSFCRPLLQPDGAFCSDWKGMPIRELGPMLTLAGHQPSEKELGDLKKAAGPDAVIGSSLTWRMFIRLEGLYRANLKEILKENQGFTANEAARMEEDFIRYTVKNGNHILYGGLEKLVHKYIPHVIVDERFTLNLRELVKASDLNHTNKIEFREFLWIMRRLFDRDGKETMTRAIKVRDDLGYSREQGMGLRELFNAVDEDLSGSVDLSELKVLFSGLVIMNEEAEDELQVFLSRIDVGQHGALDFFEFLRLMKMLEKVNWRNILYVADHQDRKSVV